MSFTYGLNAVNVRLQLRVLEPFFGRVTIAPGHTLVWGAVHVLCAVRLWSYHVDTLPIDRYYNVDKLYPLTSLSCLFMHAQHACAFRVFTVPPVRHPSLRQPFVERCNYHCTSDIAMQRYICSLYTVRVRSTIIHDSMRWKRSSEWSVRPRAGQPFAMLNMLTCNSNLFSNHRNHIRSSRILPSMWIFVTGAT